MTIIHMVMFKFRPEVSTEHKETFTRELRKLKDLSCVKDSRLLVGGPSVTDPIERSKGFEIALLSYHQDRAALEEYQASKEHHWVTSTYMIPYREDLVRFDFEVREEDEHMCNFGRAFGLIDSDTGGWNQSIDVSAKSGESDAGTAISKGIDEA